MWFHFLKLEKSGWESGVQSVYRKVLALGKEGLEGLRSRIHASRLSPPTGTYMYLNALLHIVVVTKAIKT